MARIILAMPPFFICFIMPCIWSNWASRRFTSCTGTPEPAAMRRLREALMSSGLARSAGVMELRMPSVRRSCFSAWPPCSWPAACWNWAGSFSSSEPMSPSFLTWPSWSRKSFRSNLLPDLILDASFCASAMSMFFWACSTSDTMSPMPSTRCAMRSG